MTALREAAQQALEALGAMNPYPASKEDQRASALAALRAALAQQEEPVWMHPWPPVRAQQAEPQTIDEALQQPRAMAQAYEAGYKAGQDNEREACEKACEHQPHWVACVAAIRARGGQT